jgi:oligopeptide/dipeptide ABC transporter ATP-binding protein
MNRSETQAGPILEARQLSVRHNLRKAESRSMRGLEAVHQLSLSLEDGEILAIVGESGSGKSSLAHALAGLLPVASGDVYYRGMAASSLDRKERNCRNREVQLIFQNAHSALSPRRSIQQCLEEPLGMLAIPRGKEAERRIGAALADVNLGVDILRRYPHQLSGGQKQRIALARALLSQPALIIADELMSALDVSEQARLIKLISHLRSEKKITFLLIAHDLAVVQQLADRVGVMYLGRLLELAPTHDFYQAAAHPYSQALLRASQRGWSCGSANGPVLSGETPSALTPPSGCVFHTRCVKALKHCRTQVPEQQFLIRESAAGVPHQVQCHLYTVPQKS